MRAVLGPVMLVALVGSTAAAQTPVLMTEHDLVYLGAFAVPDSANPPDWDEWSYGGHALTYVAGGDPAGPSDGHPGSLYVAGNSQHDMVGEISIPVPVITDAFAALPRAVELQPLVDLTGGLLGTTCAACATCDCANWDVAGLEHLANVDRIAWIIHDWYNVGAEDVESLGWSNLLLSGAAGVWHIGPRPNALHDPFHNAKTSDYLLTAPAAFADTFLGGRSLLSGYHRESGALGGSQGPTLFAMAPWDDGDPPAPGADCDAIALLYYRWFLDCTDNVFTACDFDGYRVDDQWGGGAWIETPTRHGILIFGLKGLGDNCYGTPGIDCPEPACLYDQGYHSDPYEPRILFYDPDEVAQIVAGTRNPWDIQPYTHYSPQTEVFDPDCGFLSAVAVDRERGLIYVAERTAGPFGETAIHVWEVGGSLFSDGFESGDTSAWSSATP